MAGARFEEIRYFHKIKHAIRRLFGRKLKAQRDALVDFHSHTSYSSSFTRDAGGVFDAAIRWIDIGESFVDPIDRYFTKRKFYTDVAITDHAYPGGQGGIHGALEAAGELMKRGMKEELEHLIIGCEVCAGDPVGQEGAIDTLVYFHSGLNRNTTDEEAQDEFDRMKKTYMKTLKQNGASIGECLSHLKKMKDDGEIPLYSPAHILEPVNHNLKGKTIVDIFERGLIDTMEVYNGAAFPFQNEFCGILASHYGCRRIAGSDSHTSRLIFNKEGYVKYRGVGPHYSQRDIFEFVEKVEPSIYGSSPNPYIHTLGDVVYLVYKGYVLKWADLIGNAKRHKAMDFLKKSADLALKGLAIPLTSIFWPVAVVYNIEKNRRASLRLIEEIVEEKPVLLKHMRKAASHELRSIYRRYG